VPTGSYYVVVRHRNHLGVMTALPIDFSSGVGTVDFTNAATSTYSKGTNPAQAVTTTNASAMWSGDANGDGRVVYTGAGSDVDYILNSLLGGDPNGYQAGYLNGDVNLDGQIYYISTGNDGDWILYAPLGGNPGVSLEAQLP